MYQGWWLNLPFHYRLVFCAKLGIAFVLLHLDEHSQKRILCSFSGTGWLPSTTELYKAPTCPTLIRCADLFWLQTSFSWLFWRWAGKQSKEGLRRHASTNTRLRVSLLFDCKILKPITQAIYISNFIGPI